MPTIYVVMKAAREVTGEFVMVSSEKAFATREAAQLFLTGQKILWDETINGAECQCERAIHEVELEGNNVG